MSSLRYTVLLLSAWQQVVGASCQNSSVTLEKNVVERFSTGQHIFPSNFTFIINATATTTSTSSSSTNYQPITTPVTVAIRTSSPSTYIALPTHSPPPNQGFPDTRELTNHEDINYSELLQGILENRNLQYPSLTYYDGVDDPDATWPTQSLLGKRLRDSDDDDEDGPRSGRHTTAATRSRTDSWTLQELIRDSKRGWSNLWGEQSRTEEEAESERASLWSKVGAAGLSLCLVNEEAKRERKRRKTQKDGAQKPGYDPLFASNFHVPGHESSSSDADPSKGERSFPSNDEYDVILQPEIRPISQEELVAEVQGIYAGLFMVEAKCIEVEKRKRELEQAELGGKITDNLSSTDLADSEVGKSSILADQSDQSSDTDVWSSRETLSLAADPAEVFGNPTPVIAQEKHAAKDLSPPSAVMEQTFTGFSETNARLEAAEWKRFEVDTEKSPESTLQQHDLVLDDESWHALKCPGAFPQSRDEIFLESQMSTLAATIPELQLASNPSISGGLRHRTLHSCQELLRNSFSDSLKDLAQSVLPTSQLHLENMWQDYLESEVMMSWDSEEAQGTVEVLDKSVSLSEPKLVQQDSSALKSPCLQQSVFSCSPAPKEPLAVPGPASELIEKQDEALDGDQYEDFHDCHEYTPLPWEIVDPKALKAPGLADSIKPFESQSPDPGPQLKIKDHSSSSTSEALETDGTNTLLQTLSALELVPRQAYSEQQGYLPGSSVPSIVSRPMKHSNGHSTTAFTPQFISPMTLILSESDRYRQRRYEAQDLGSFRRTRRSEGTGRRRYYSSHDEEDYNDDHDDSAYGYLDDFQRAQKAGRTTGRRHDRDDYYSLRPSDHQRTRRLENPGLRSFNDGLSSSSSPSLPRGDKQSLPTKRNSSTGLTAKYPTRSTTEKVKYKCTQHDCNHLFSTPARLQRHKRTCGNPAPATSVTGEDTGPKTSAVLKDTQFGTPKSTSSSPPPPPPPASPTSSHLTQSSPSNTTSTTTPNPVESHICSYCQKSFPKPYALRKHTLYHTKPFACPVTDCEMRFGRQRDLERHEKAVHDTSSGEKEEFRCGVEGCGKEYYRKDNLQRHERIKHGDRLGF